jgi:adenosylcobinamide-GDP ribazoletransferase
MISLLAAFQFLTVLPAVVRRPFTPQEMGRAVGWYPLVGLAVGGALLGLFSVALKIFPPIVCSGLTLLTWILLTRALHFDGFIDMCDALFGGFTPERRLEIMKDSRIGAFGLAGGALLLLLKFSALADPTHLYPGIVLAPVLGRWVISMALFVYPYARQQGLGRDMKDNVRWPQALLATFLALSVAWVTGGSLGLLVALVAALVLVGGAGFILKHIPGLTGDSYGALCEGVELLVLLLYSIRP